MVHDLPLHGGRDLRTAGRDGREGAAVAVPSPFSSSLALVFHPFLLSHDIAMHSHSGRIPAAGAVGGLVLAAAIGACSQPESTVDRDRAPSVDTLGALSVGEDAWPGLLHPVAVAVDGDGRVLVGDRGDKTVKVFDAGGGRRLHTAGGEGAGPGELSAINDLEDMSGESIVLDNQLGRVVRFDSAGGARDQFSIEGDREELGRLGADRLILATSARWSLPGADGARPLFEVVDRDGEVVFTGGGRAEASSPFAEHVMNFVFPAGTPDGGMIWLAYMNDTRVVKYDVDAREYGETVNRSVPFDWESIPEDFEPSRSMMARGRKADVPFDAVSQSIDTDREGNAYVLTMLAPAPSPGQTPAEVAVDVIDAVTGDLRRYVVDGPATDLAVSPGGHRFYLVNPSMARIRVYERP